MVEGTIRGAAVKGPDWTVKGIQRFEPKLEFFGLREQEALVQAQIEVGVCGSTDVADAAGPERAVGWIAERDVRKTESDTDLRDQHPGAAAP